jgi:hypothetical protein
MPKHRDIMYEIPFPSQESWPIISKMFAIPLFPNIPTSQDHHLMKKG